MMNQRAQKELVRYRDIIKNKEIGDLSPYDLSNLRLLIDSPKNHRESASEIFDVWKRYRNRKDEDLNFYLHIPFCYHQCHFCCYAGETPEGKEEVEEYVQRLIKYFHFFSPAFDQKIFDNLHIGGGTPSILSRDLLYELLNKIDELFQFNSLGQKSFEFNPSSFSFDKMKTLRDFGFNKVSVGVQTFDEKMLEINNRADQTNELVEETMKAAHHLGFEWINIDLLSGMYGDTKEKSIMSFEKALSLNPHSIYLYSIKPTTFYLKEIYNLSFKDYFDKAKRSIESVIDEITLIADRAGYMSLGSGALPSLGYQNTWVFLQKEFNISKFYCFSNEQDSTVFGLGYKSLSSIKRKIRYTMDDPLKDDPESYKFFVTPYDEKKSMLFFIFNNLSLTAGISRERFQKTYHKDIMDEFKDVILKLKETGMVSVKEKEIVFTSDLPEDRLVCALFFLEEEKAKEILNNKKNKFKNDMNRDQIKIDESNQNKGRNVFDENLKEIMANKTAVLLDGIVERKEKDSLVILSDNEKTEVFLTDLSKIIESEIKKEGDKPSFIKDLSWSEITKGDKVSIFGQKKDNKMEAILIRRII